jgi:GNAT superfamily N-acetyltransferase
LGALERRIAESVADEAHALPFGYATLTPSLPLVWDLNLVCVDGGAELADAGELAAAADEILGKAPQLAHRKVVLESADRHRTLAEGLKTRGWKLAPLRVLVHRGDSPPATAIAGPARPEENVDALDRELAREQDLPAALVDQLREFSRRSAEAVEHVAVAGRDAGGEPVTLTDVYLDGGVALIEDVATLRRARGRGIGGATVAAAVALARERGADHICLLAEGEVADGFYAPLGFEQAGVRLNAVLTTNRDAARTFGS